MCDRCFHKTLDHAEQAAHLFLLGCLVVLAVAVSGLGARADDRQLISTSGLSASDPGVLQVARTPSLAAVDEETSDVRGLAQDSLISLQVGTQITAQRLDLHVPSEQAAARNGLVEDNARNAARIARIASCHQASEGRYHSEENGAFANALSTTSKFDAAMTHFIARRQSRIQFDSCTSY